MQRNLVWLCPNKHFHVRARVHTLLRPPSIHLSRRIIQPQENVDSTNSLEEQSSELSGEFDISFYVLCKSERVSVEEVKLRRHLNTAYPLLRLL